MHYKKSAAFMKVSTFVPLGQPHKWWRHSALTEIISISSLALHIFHLKFWAIPCNRSWDMTIKRIFYKTELQHPLLRYKHKNCTIVLSNSIYILYINFCFISSNWSRDLRIPKNLENVWLQRHLSNDFHQKLIDTN